MSSDSENRIVFSTYLGKGTTKFRFLFDDVASDTVILDASEYQALVPHVIFPPHWWQKL